MEDTDTNQSTSIFPPHPLVSVSINDEDEDEDPFAITAFFVPRNHPSAFTISPSVIYTNNPTKFYSICPCLPKTADYSKGTPPGARDINDYPILKGEQLISSVEEFKQTTEDLLSRPIFAAVKCRYEWKTHEIVRTRTKYWHDSLVVVVDTSHVYIKDKLKKYFDKAINLLEQGLPFCLKIDFAPNVQRTIAKHLEPNEISGCILTEGLLEIYLTNHSKPTCDLCLQKDFILWCFPIWILGGSCYTAYRKSKVKDIFCEVYDLPTKYLTNSDELEFISTDRSSSLLF